MVRRIAHALILAAVALISAPAFDVYAKHHHGEGETCRVCSAPSPDRRRKVADKIKASQEAADLEPAVEAVAQEARSAICDAIAPVTVCYAHLQELDVAEPTRIPTEQPRSWADSSRDGPSARAPPHA